ncbi:hypothetical protein GCM10009863_08240 [Streptomyces axinellae]|uniref:Uncharacterized protein n=1 Tax=Streptomyces axinellae TaxID=552788 RepID=A0ABP6C238_9ACTN
MKERSGPLLRGPLRSVLSQVSRSEVLGPIGPKSRAPEAPEDSEDAEDADDAALRERQAVGPAGAVASSGIGARGRVRWRM